MTLGNNLVSKPTKPIKYEDGLPDTCSFCGKHQTEVALLISLGKRQAVICDECIGLCMHLIQMEAPDRLEQMINDATAHYPAPPPEPITIEDLAEQMAGLRPSAKIWLSLDDVESLSLEGDAKKKLAKLANDFHCEMTDAPDHGGIMITKRG